MTMRAHRYLLAIFALGLAQSSGAETAAGPAADHTRSAAEARFEVLRGDPAAPPDGVERPKISGAVGSTSRGAVNVVFARRDASHKVHVATSANEVCLAVREADGSGSLGCTPAGTDDGTRPLTSINSLGKDTWRLTALLVDGIRTVEVVTAGGRSRAVKVHNNIADAVVSDPIERMTWTTPDGERAELRPAPDR